MKHLSEILFLVPKNLLSRWVGVLMHLRFPEPIKSFLIQKFAEAYQIRLDEAEKPVSEYASIGDFFIRKLKLGARPIGSDSLVHPADSRITMTGQILEGELLQAKGRKYSLNDFVGSSERAQAYVGGFYLTYYLCPTDYHRVHSPVSGQVREIVHLPGDLWPVNDWSVGRIPRLFCVNERVGVEIDTPYGRALAMFVGATNVGQISVGLWPELRTNVSMNPSDSRRSQSKTCDAKIEKGAELGIFHMGSTVILLLSPEWQGRRPGLTDEVRRLSGKIVQMGRDFSG